MVTREPFEQKVFSLCLSSQTRRTSTAAAAVFVASMVEAIAVGPPRYIMFPIYAQERLYKTIKHGGLVGANYTWAILLEVVHESRYSENF